MLLPGMPAAASVSPLQKDDVVIAYHSLTGMASFIGASTAGRPIREATALDKSATAEEVALSFLAVEGSKFGIADARSDLSVLRKTQTDEFGTNTVRFQQTYQGIPVLAGEMIVLMDSDKNVFSASGEILPNVGLDIAPVIDAATATQTALETTAKENNVNVDQLQSSAPELWVYNPALLTPYKGETILGWRIEVTPKTHLLPIRQLVLVEAKRGGIALSFNQVDSAKNRLTYDAGGQAVQPGTLICNEANPNCIGGSTDAVKAHLYAGQTYDFYMTNHGRDSIDGAGMSLISTVNFDDDPYDGFPFENAFWDGAQMTYGPGFSTADDVVAHELTHGVTEHESGLFYYYQSGAINESFSDVWGEFMDLTNGSGTDTPGTRWQMGEDLPASIGVIRNMSDPTIYGDPDKMDSVNYYLGSGDNGGVHTNSGVNNKAAYLMVDGATFNGTVVTGLGITKVAKIYYYAQANLLTSGADYADLYYALQTSCARQVDTAGITTADCQQVSNAIYAVRMNLQPVAGFNSETAACDVVGQYPVNSFYDNLEAGSGNWVSGSAVGTNRWSLNSIYGSFAHSGQNFLYADDYPAAITDSRIRMVNSVLVPTNGKMLFHHAYDLEYGYDGGVLEYTINGGASWTDAGSLMDGNGYDSTLLAATNPLGARSAFTGTSHGYISTRLNLNSLAGQNVMFRFRMGVDSSGYIWGWWLDDVQIYKCQPKDLVNAYVGGALQGTYPLAAGESTRDSYVSVNNGPIQALSAVAIVTSERVLYKVNGVNTSYSEMIGLPNNQLDTTYWMPWYNNVTLDTQLRLANVSGSTATVHVYVGGVEMTSSGSPFTLTANGAGRSTRVSFAGVNNGPLQVVSNVAIIASERVLYKVNGVDTSYSEMIGLSDSQLSTTYWMPWYNNVTLDTQLRLGNVSGLPATVHVYVGGVQMIGSPFSLTASGAGQSTRVSFVGVNNGPLQVVSDRSIVASERVLYKVNGVDTSYSEMIGLPSSQVNTTYWMPWYNNATLDTQLRLANVSGAAATVHVYVGGVEMTSSGSPFSLTAGGAGQSTRVSFVGVNNGHLQVVSDVPIIASERVLYKVNGVDTSYSEMIGLPDHQLDTTYWMPWYNNLTLDTQLRLAVP